MKKTRFEESKRLQDSSISTNLPSGIFL